MLVAAAKTGKIVNIKKGQFLAPAQMKYLAEKVIESGNDRVVITDRGASFGYNNLVSDMRAIPIIQELGYPVIFDATHSVQLPGGCGSYTSGDRKFVAPLAKAAVAAGANGLFFEVHPNPDEALCDGPNMINLIFVIIYLNLSANNILSKKENESKIILFFNYSLFFTFILPNKSLPPKQKFRMRQTHKFR